MSKNLEKTYNPKEIEAKLYEKWCEEKYFHAEVDRSKKPFTTVMPPPNITGKLHMGHALSIKNKKSPLQYVKGVYKRGTTFVPRNKSISYLSQFYNGNHPVISYSPFFRYPAPKLPSATTSRKPSLSL